MNRKKTALILLSAFIALFSAAIVTGAISFSPMPDIFQEYFQGTISNTSYSLSGWDLDVESADSLSVWINGTVQVSGDYLFEISIFDGEGFEIVNATRTISLTEGVYSNEQFYLTASDLAPRFRYIDIEVSR